MSFEPATTRFSATNAEALAVAATIAYEADNTKAQRRAEEELGLDQFFEPFEHHNFVIDTEGFVAASKQHVILAFRGTEPGKIKDWATDALAAPSAFRWFFELAPDVGNVHSGFANSLRDSWADSIRKSLKKAGAGTRRTLWITGHSLRGALAVLAGGACKYDPDTLLPVNGLYTFGQPRVSLHDFCNNIETKFGSVYYRFVNDRDVVPRVPPRAFDSLSLPDAYACKTAMPVRRRTESSCRGRCPSLVTRQPESAIATPKTIIKAHITRLATVQFSRIS